MLYHNLFFFFFKAGALQAFQTPKCHLGMQGAAASSGWGSSRWHQHGYSAFQGGGGQGLWLWEGWEQGSAVGVEGWASGAQSSYRGSAAAGSGLRPPQCGNLSLGSLTRNQRGSVVRVDITCGVQQPIPACAPIPMGSAAMESRAVRNIPPVPHWTCFPQERGREGSAPSREALASRLSQPGPIIPLILEPLKRINSWEQSIPTFPNFGERTIGTHVHFSLSAASSTPPAPSLTCGSLCQQPIFSNSSAISFILMHLFTGND